MKDPLITHTFHATGTVWVLTIYGEEGLRARAEATCAEAVHYTQWFESTFSRFIDTSLVTSFRHTKGVLEVPRECTDILHLYERAYRMTAGAITPTIAVTLSDAGYDAAKRLTPETTIRTAPAYESVLRVVDDTHIEILTPGMIDFGAIGKGYLVDALAGLIQARGFTHFLVNGGGDIRYENNSGEPLTVGLEDPRNQSMVIGTTTLVRGGLCGSATNRRRWGAYNHYIDPRTGVSPEHIAAVWVKARCAAEADMLTSCLFFMEPSKLLPEQPFEYCIITDDMSAHFSDGFGAELF
jgi:FAD:protein FMN transferase